MRISPSATRAPVPARPVPARGDSRKGSTGIRRRTWQTGDGAVPCRPEVPIEIGIRSMEHIAAGNDDHVDATAWQWVVPPEKLAGQTFRAVPVDGVTDLLGCDNPQPRRGSGASDQEQGEITGGNAGALVENVLEFAAPPHALRLGEALRRHARRALKESKR